MIFSGMGEKPVAEVQKSRKGRGVLPDEGGGEEEVAAVGDEVPESGESAQTLHGGEVDGSGLKNLVGRVGTIDHLVLGVVADDGGAAEALEEADLDFLGAERKQAIEACGEGLEVFAGEAGDEVGVDVNAGLVAQEFEVVFDALRVLPAANALADFGVEALDADFELQCAGGELFDQVAQAVGETVGDHLEMEEEIGLVALPEEFEDGAAEVEIEIESAIDELEAAQAAVEEALQCGDEAINHGRRRAIPGHPSSGP